MNRIHTAVILLSLGTSFSLQSHAQTGTCKGMTVGQNTSLDGFVPFPKNDLWRENVTNAMVDGTSDAIIATIGANVGLHPDFGSGILDGSYIGIPYQVVSGQAKVPVTYNAYGNQSDPGPMPIPASALIEGYPDNSGSGDRHVLVLDRDNCFLYELYGTTISNGTVTAASGAIWDLHKDSQRPYTWTSADAAGLPVFPGLARYDEVANGIHHALRFTLPQSKAAFVPPAKHWAATSTNAYAAPMGMRLRLKASVDISGFTPQAQVILQALKTYGMILADNGSAMFISGAPNDSWNNDDLHNIGQITASDFEVLQESPLYTAANVPQGAAPVINSFTATPTATGKKAKLSWTVTGANYTIISPEVGVLRVDSVEVEQTATTTYTLYATNDYGQTTATVTVTVK